MIHLRKATLWLPALLLVTGLAIPVVVGGGSARPPAPVHTETPTYAGRTAVEWHALAMASLEGDAFGAALRYLKTAEKVEPGKQYSTELASVRRARKRARDIEANRDRMLAGEPERLEFDANGAVLAAHRSTVALPGESLWTLAVRMVAARRACAPDDVGLERGDVYAAWDAFTDLNGLRELEVGEKVLVPLSASETLSISESNARDLERVRLAHAALDSGGVDRAASLRARIAGEFALVSEDIEVLDRRIRQSQIGQLLASASDIAESAGDIPRSSRHAELVASLQEARAKLEEVRELAGAAPEYDVENVAELLRDAERFSLKADGTVAATKPSGVVFTEFALETVEWFLDRELARSGAEFPNHAGKTRDEVAWARYLADASALASGDGVDFAGLLVADDARHVRLPNPGAYFEE